jgi:hypothetical protein
MTTKLEFTQQMLAQLPDNQPTVELAIQDWWQDIRPVSGLRLSMQGFDIFNQLGVMYYEFEVPPSMPNKPNQLITLNNKLTCPYYIKPGKNPKLILFGSQEAIMMSLYGDIERFIRGLSR